MKLGPIFTVSTRPSYPYRQWEKWWLSTHGQFVKERANRPSRIFSDKFPAYMPCRLTETFTLESKYRNPEEFKDDDPERELDFETTIKDRVKNPPNPYFEIFPERARYFNCGWESDGLDRFSTFGTGRLPEPFPFDAAPFQQHFDAAHHRKHRAYALVDVRIVEHGPEILKILLSDANDAELRKRICTSFGDSCIAPRVIALVGNRRFDQAIGYCFHELAGGIVLPPMGCVLAALRLKKSKRYIMEALFSPDTKFYGEPGNGIGDTDISCTKRSPETMLAI